AVVDTRERTRERLLRSDAPSGAEEATRRAVDRDGRQRGGRVRTGVHRPSPSFTVAPFRADGPRGDGGQRDPPMGQPNAARPEDCRATPDALPHPMTLRTPAVISLRPLAPVALGAALSLLSPLAMG